MISIIAGIIVVAEAIFATAEVVVPVAITVTKTAAVVFGTIVVADTICNDKKEDK